MAVHHGGCHCGRVRFEVVNLRCLEPDTLGGVRIVPFDGRDWERHGGELAHRSKEK